MNTYGRLLEYIKPYKAKLIIAFACTFAYSVSHSLVSAAVYVMVNGFYNKGNVVVTGLPALDFLGKISFSAAYIPYIVFFVFLTRGIFDYISNYLMASVGLHAVTDVQNNLFRHLASQSADFYGKGRTGDLISRIMGDVQGIQNGITTVILDLVKQPLVILFNVPLVFIWGGKVAVLGLVTFPLMLIPIVLLGRKMRKTSLKVAQTNADITSMLSEIFNGILLIKAYTMEERQIARFQRSVRRVLGFLKRVLKITVVQRPLIEVLGAVGAALAVSYGYRYLDPGRFGAFIASLFILYEPIKKISKVNVTIQHALACGQRIFEIIDREPTIRDLPGAVRLDGAIERIAFDRVSFSYRPETIVLDNIDLNVERGEVVAFVGLSGAGKSTLVNLIPRFYDVSAGSIMINGKDVRSYTLETLRKNIAIVMQDTVLFNESVSENISCNDPNVSIDNVVRAAQAARAHDFISKLPKGYDTVIGERGITLSGGQCQRLSIARAFYKDAPILILDEATSQLDTESEREIQRALETLFSGRTVFVIAHRLSTITNADRIVVLEQGRIVQNGTNDMLMAEGGIYKRLKDLQFQS